MDVVSKSTTQFVVKARKVTGVSFSDSFATSRPSAYLQESIPIMGNCPIGHGVCAQVNEKWIAYASSTHTHTGGVSGATNAPVLAADFDWMAIPV